MPSKARFLKGWQILHKEQLESNGYSRNNKAHANFASNFGVICKQWPLAPNSQDSLITRANVSRRVTFFSKMAFGECRQVWRVLAKQVSKCLASPNIFQFWGFLYSPDSLNSPNLPNSRHYSEIQKCRDLCSINCNLFVVVSLNQIRHLSSVFHKL